ncbi:MAG: 30S ribosome-binding factor RbfA [Desulfosarcina sp.]|nr:30S ribosome-binding factor RbfA [Desulfobacterales bacterium]
MKTFARSVRVSRHIHNTLAELLNKKIRDPRLRTVTITEVDLSPDLRLAKIYFSTSGGDRAVADAVAGFQKARSFIKRNLAGCLGLRYMPEIRFYHDDSLEYGARIDTILKTIGDKNEKPHNPSEE